MTDHHLVHPDFDVRYGEGDVWMEFDDGRSREMECTGYDPTADHSDPPSWREWDRETWARILWLEQADVTPLAGEEFMQGVTIRDPERARDALVRQLVQCGPCTATRGAVAQMTRMYDLLRHE